jgi:hypothetical protein
MANRKEKIERGTFGAAPVLGTLPNVKGLGDDVAMFTAIGTIGGNLQWMVASTMFFFGSLAKKKGEKYNGGKAYEAYFTHAKLSMTADSKKTAKASATVYAEFAQVKKWDTQEMAGRIFDHPHGSQGQKAAAVRKVMENHADKPPTEEELIKLLPKKKADSDKAATIKQWANGKKKSFADIRTDENLWPQIEGNVTLLARFEAADTAIVAFAAMAATITDMVAKKDKAAAATVAADAALKAGLKAKRQKGATIN